MRQNSVEITIHDLPVNATETEIRNWLFENTRVSRKTFPEVEFKKNTQDGETQLRIELWHPDMAVVQHMKYDVEVFSQTGGMTCIVPCMFLTEDWKNDSENMFMAEFVHQTDLENFNSLPEEERNPKEYNITELEVVAHYEHNGADIVAYKVTAKPDFFRYAFGGHDYEEQYDYGKVPEMNFFNVIG